MMRRTAIFALAVACLVPGAGADRAPTVRAERRERSLPIRREGLGDARSSLSARASAFRGGESIVPSGDEEEQLVAKAPPASQTAAAATVVAPGGVSARERVTRLLLWEDPRMTGAAFAAGHLLFWLLLVKKWTLISLGSWALFLAILGGFLHTTFAKFLVGFLGPQVVRSPTLGVAYLQPRHLLPLVGPTVALVNRAIDDVKRACWCVSYAHSAKYLAGSWLLSTLSRQLSGGFVSYALFLGAFSAPKLVQTHRAELDELQQLASAQLSEAKAQLQALLEQQRELCRAQLAQLEDAAKAAWEHAVSVLDSATKSLTGAVRAAQAPGVSQARSGGKAEGGSHQPEAAVAAGKRDDDEAEDDEDADE